MEGKNHEIAKNTPTEQNPAKVETSLPFCFSDQLQEVKDKITSQRYVDQIVAARQLMVLSFSCWVTLNKNVKKTTTVGGSIDTKDNSSSV